MASPFFACPIAYPACSKGASTSLAWMVSPAGNAALQGGRKSTYSGRRVRGAPVSRPRRVRSARVHISNTRDPRWPAVDLRIAQSRRAG